MRKKEKGFEVAPKPIPLGVLPEFKEMMEAFGQEKYRLGVAAGRNHASLLNFKAENDLNAYIAKLAADLASEKEKRETAEKAWQGMFYGMVYLHSKKENVFTKTPAGEVLKLTEMAGTDVLAVIKTALAVTRAFSRPRSVRSSPLAALALACRHFTPAGKWKRKK